MSSVRGGTFRGRARGSTSSTPNRGRSQASTRSRGSSAGNSRGSTTTRGGFGQPPRQDAGRAPRGSDSAPTNRTKQPSLPATSFGGATTGGSWQERYQALLRAREEERTNAIRQGLIADPEKPRSLSEAITPAGTCQDMCAEYERVQRVVQKDVWNEELNSNHSAFAIKDKEPDETRMVKKFRRAAAGLEEQLPSDLRPPAVLEQTCDYLFNDVVGNASSLALVHHFVWDRTRAIRNDFSIQQVTRPDEVRIAIECYERIARFHILSLHQLALPEKPYSKYDWQQEREQLDRTLLSLMQLYDDSRGRIDLPHEAEFRSYCVIFQLQDPTPDLEDRVQTWPPSIIRDTRVQKAVDLYMTACNILDAQGPLKPRATHLIARQDWQRFWALIASKEVSYLMACVAEIYFNLVRRTVLNSLFRTFRANTSLVTSEWTVEVLCELLAFDEEEEVYAFCEKFGFSFKERDDGQPHLDLNSVRGRTLPDPSSGLSTQGKTRLVEDKRYGRTLPAVINGLSVEQAEERGFVSEAEEDKGMEDMVEERDDDTMFVNGVTDTNDTAIDDGESLFMPEAEAKQPPAPASSGWNAQPSITNGDINPNFAFGRPSDNGQSQGIFARPQISQAASPATPTPARSATTFNFLPAGPSDAGAATSKPSLFGFLKTDTNGQNSNESQSSQPSFERPPTEQPKSFANPTPQISDRSTSFAFNPPPASTSQSSIIQPSLFAPSTIPPLQAEQNFLPAEQSAPQSSFNQPTATPAPPSQQSETKVSQTHVTNQQSLPHSSTNQHAQTPGLGLSAKRPSFSTDTRPKKPSPLSYSFTAGDDSSAIATATEAPGHIQTNTSTGIRFEEGNYQASSKDGLRVNEAMHATDENLEDFDATLTRVANELVFEPDTGYLQQYIEFAVRQTITEVHEQVVTERLEKKAEEWRRHLLQTKYLSKWKQIAWQSRLLRSGRERRDRRKRRQDQRTSQETDAHSHFESQASSARDMGSLVSATSPHNQNGNAPQEVIRASTEQQTMAGSKRPVSSHGADNTPLSRERGHKRLKSTSHVDDRGRVTKPTAADHPNADILKRSAFLDFSVPSGMTNTNRSTTRSNYFRYKAMGIKKAELSASAGTKRRSESMQVSSQTPPPALRSPSGHLSMDQSTNAATMPPPSTTPSHSVRSTPDDEALFARLNAARESLKKSTSYYKSEVRKEEQARSSISPQSSNESPSLAQARVDARLRASKAESETGSWSITRDVPAYRLRESKFVPRVNYERAIERAKEIRESRSRETSRPESRLDQSAKEHTTDSPPKATSSLERIDDQQAEVQNNVATAFAPKSNGLPVIHPDQTQETIASSTSKPFAFGGPKPVSFADHTTEMPPQNPFLQGSVPNSFGQLPTQSFSGFRETHSFLPENEDHTIDPLQINNTLANSFGNSQHHGQTQFGFSKPSSRVLPQQDSYLPSESISLSSDDEDDQVARFGQTNYYQDATQTDDAPGGIEDDTTEDDGDQQNSYMHTNPYASLADVAETESDQYSEDGGGDAERQTEYDEDETEVEGRHVYPGIEENVDGPNGYAGDVTEDEDAVNGDIDENDSLVDEDDSQGYDEEDEGFDVRGYEYDEEDGDGYENETAQQWQGQDYEDTYYTAPEKTTALQSVGNTQEEAIELSD